MAITATGKNQLRSAITARVNWARFLGLIATNEWDPMANNDKNADRKSGSKPKLLSGGNPQIPKGEGDEPVQA